MSNPGNILSLPLIYFLAKWMKGVKRGKILLSTTRGCFRSHVPFTPVFTLHGWLARHSGCLEKRNCHNCRNYFRLFPFAADWMENARCENLGLSRHHSGAQHNTEHLSSFVAETEKWKKHARCGNVFIAHCHSCTANTCIVMVTCFAAVSAQVHVHVTPWYSAQVTFSCLPCFAKKYGFFD